MSDARMAGLLLGAAFLIRFVLYLGTAIFGTDSAQFLLMADRMSEGRFDEALSYTYHPLYPLLTAVARVLVPGTSTIGATEYAGFWVSMVLGSAAVVPLFHLVRSIFGRPVAFFSALIYSFQWHTVELQADVMTEGTFCFFFFGTAWLIWRAMEEPRPERFVVAGGAAVAAYLTRPEGILAVAAVIGWPLLDLAIRRDRPWMRLAGTGASLATIALLAFPYLVWVHSKMGGWRLSAKFSVAQAAKTAEEPEVVSGSAGARYGKILRSMGQVAGVLTPFALVGFAGLRGHGWRGPLFFFSFPLGYLGGLLVAFRSHYWVSYRYVVPLMGMLLVLAGLGMVVALRLLERRRPEPRWTAIAAGVLLLFIFAPCVRALRPHRHDEAGVREAGAWIRARGSSAPVFSTVDKIGYFTGASVKAYDGTFDEFRERVEKGASGYCVYLEEDLKKGRPPYLARLGEIPGVSAPVTVLENPSRGIQRVYIRAIR